MTPPSSRLSRLFIPAILLLLLWGMTACSPPAPAATKSAVPAHETQVADAPPPTRTLAPSPTPTPSPTSTPTRPPTPSPTHTPTPTPILATRVYAIAAPFATIRDDIPWSEIETRWADPEAPPLLVLEPETPFLQTLFDSLPAHPISPDQLRDALDQPDALAILPFDQLDPTLKILTIDGLNPLDKGLDLADYPLALTITGPAARDLPATNRDPNRITTLIMTGVTAMSRGTAEKMEQKGVLYPALVISDTLAAADITHVSNEVPFIEGCKVNNTYMNLILCSDYDYWQALEAIGTDIVGLSGNHVNDFGREGARESIRFYRERGIPIYGSGLNEEEACQPLLWEDHGNTFAFIAALAWWPDSAWATETEPGACYFYRNYDKILATVRQLSREVDIVSVELQFQETYNPWPIESQIEEFRALREAGADIVTGVQSHVPQAAEPYAHPPGIILYGLGNLFFDQMQSWETRTALIARHTIYDGRLVSTELLTTVLEDFAQPRWATAKERAEILQRIFEAAPPPPGQTAKARPNQVATKSTANATPRPAAPPTPFPTERVLPPPDEHPQPHYLFARPLPPDANLIAAGTYLFGNTSNGKFRIHHGYDIPNPLGTPVLAPAAGLIVHAGADKEPNVLGPYPDFFGKAIVLQLDQDWQGQPVFVLFGHLNTVEVAVGDRVEPGQRIGTVGMEGIAIGPHLHLEVRLPENDYPYSRNPGFWQQPLPGRGAIAGQVITPDGRAWANARIFIYRLDENGRNLYRILPTYDDDPGLQPDPVYAENFLLSDAPAGRYELVLRIGKRIFRQQLEFAAGEIAYARFVVEP